MPLDQLLGAGGCASGAQHPETEDAARTAVTADPLQEVLGALRALQTTVGALATSQQALNAQVGDLSMRVESQQAPSGNASIPSGATSGLPSGFSMPMPSGAPCASPFVPSGGTTFPGVFQVPSSQPVGTRASGTQDTSLRGVDAKLIPSMPTVNCDSWKSRPQEICGFHSYVESLTSWLSTLAPAFGPEIREIIQRRHELMDHELSDMQHGRSQRLFYILKQVLSNSVRCLGIIRVYEGGRLGACNGFELLRRLVLEFSIHTRAEALYFRQSLLNYRSKQKNIRNLVNDLDSEVLTFQRLLQTSLDPSWCAELALQDSDMYRWLLLNLDNESGASYNCTGVQRLSSPHLRRASRGLSD